MRILADLDQRQIDALKELSERNGMSRAALLREAVDDLIAKKRQAGMEEAFGIWKGRTDITDGLAYQEMLRAEWPD
jgi:hypothetical protein